MGSRSPRYISRYTGQHSGRCFGNLFPKLALLVTTLLLCMLPAVPVTSQDTTYGPVYTGSLNGVINSFSASYLKRLIREAERNQARAVIIQIDTPGGLASAMLEMTKDIMASEVPVIVYVAPSGARAASAGMYITISANIAAMAPGTHIGSATPVSLTADKDQVRRQKVIQSFASAARSIAQKRGRNADWVDRAVRNADSATSDEALKLRVIDLIANDTNDLLDKIDGRAVTLDRGTVILSTRGSPLTEVSMTIIEEILHVITDPNIAYLLMILGMLGVVAEFFHPGIYLPGIVGVLALALAFVGFGALPISWTGVALLVLAVVLMIAEAQAPGFGGLGVGSIAAFVVGSLLLFAPFGPVSPALPAVGVSPWLIALMTSLFAAFFVLVISKITQMKRRPVITGTESLIGKHGTVERALTPRGIVAIEGERWTAESAEGSIPAGTDVEVVAASGVTLTVRPAAGP